MNPPGVKVCGVCEPGDAALAVAAGASYVGVIRVPGAVRTRPAEQAAVVCRAAEGAARVGVYVDAPLSTMLEEAESLGLDVIQLHGSEPPARLDELAAAGLEVWKVVKPVDAAELEAAAELYVAADLLLVEGRSSRGHGGVGARFDWAALEPAIRALPPTLRHGVGGGLTPDNVAEAARRFRPAVVDVSSGVESRVGRKDRRLVEAFIAAAGSAAGGAK